MAEDVWNFLPDPGLQATTRQKRPKRLPVGSGPLATGLGASAGSYRLAASCLSCRSFGGLLALMLYLQGRTKPRV